MQVGHEHAQTQRVKEAFYGEGDWKQVFHFVGYYEHVLFEKEVGEYFDDLGYGD